MTSSIKIECEEIGNIVHHSPNHVDSSIYDNLESSDVISNNLDIPYNGPMRLPKEMSTNTAANITNATTASTITTTTNNNSINTTTTTNNDNNNNSNNSSSSNNNNNNNNNNIKKTIGNGKFMGGNIKTHDIGKFDQVMGPWKDAFRTSRATAKYEQRLATQMVECSYIQERQSGAKSSTPDCGVYCMSTKIHAPRRFCGRLPRNQRPTKEPDDTSNVATRSFNSKSKHARDTLIGVPHTKIAKLSYEKEQKQTIEYDKSSLLPVFKDNSTTKAPMTMTFKTLFDTTVMSWFIDTLNTIPEELTYQKTTTNDVNTENFTKIYNTDQTLRDTDSTTIQHDHVFEGELNETIYMKAQSSQNNSTNHIYETRRNRAVP
jgi:hypothetical protein